MFWIRVSAPLRVTSKCGCTRAVSKHQVTWTREKFYLLRESLNVEVESLCISRGGFCCPLWDLCERLYFDFHVRVQHSNVELELVEGLQILWGAWNTSTPNTRSNLLNWVTPPPGETPWPCYDSDKNWRGVTCLRYQLNATQWDTWVVGL